MAEIAKVFSDENNPLNIHYDASREVRAKGAGFYQFSADEETRKAQMEELKASREETERVRKEMGAEDIKPGVFEGMRDGEAGTAGATGVQSRAMEKRKRDIAERRQLLEAKRRKLKGTDAPAPPSEPISLSSSQHAGQEVAPRFTTPVVPPEGISSKMSSSKQDRKASDISNDPFAALEVQGSSKGKGKNKATPVINEADSFLAQLEEEFLESRIKK